MHRLFVCSTSWCVEWSSGPGTVLFLAPYPTHGIGTTVVVAVAAAVVAWYSMLQMTMMIAQRECSNMPHGTPFPPALPLGRRLLLCVDVVRLARERHGSLSPPDPRTSHDEGDACSGLWRWREGKEGREDNQSKKKTRTSHWCRKRKWSGDCPVAANLRRPTWCARTCRCRSPAQKWGGGGLNLVRDGDGLGMGVRVWKHRCHQGVYWQSSYYIVTAFMHVCMYVCMPESCCGVASEVVWCIVVYCHHLHRPQQHLVVFTGREQKPL